jgi:hypothetical protein
MPTKSSSGAKRKCQKKELDERSARRFEGTVQAWRLSVVSEKTVGRNWKNASQDGCRE